MAATNYIVIPKTNIRLYDGDQVTISNRHYTFTPSNLNRYNIRKAVTNDLQRVQKRKRRRNYERSQSIF